MSVIVLQAEASKESPFAAAARRTRSVPAELSSRQLVTGIAATALEIPCNPNANRTPPVNCLVRGMAKPPHRRLAASLRPVATRSKRQARAAPGTAAAAHRSLTLLRTPQYELMLP
jgi:hypothetical protein